MLTIHQEEIKIFEDPYAPYFVEKTEKYLKESYPIHCSILGDNALREIFNFGRKQAKVYGLTQQSGVSFYIELMLLLGKEFNRDIQLPWASVLLNNMTYHDPLVKAQDLYNVTILYLDFVFGLDAQILNQALNRALENPSEYPNSSIQFENVVNQHLNFIWPEKYEFLGETIIQQLITQGLVISKNYGLTTQYGAFQCITFMFMLGSYFYLDPMNQWAIDILCDKTQNPKVRCKRLHTDSIEYFKKWL